MHCHICDRTLSEAEIVYNNQTHEYEPCGTCLSAIFDAAYSGRFSPDGEDEVQLSLDLDELCDQKGFDVPSYAHHLSTHEEDFE